MTAVWARRSVTLGHLVAWPSILVAVWAHPKHRIVIAARRTPLIVRAAGKCWTAGHGHVWRAARSLGSSSAWWCSMWKRSLIKGHGSSLLLCRPLSGVKVRSTESKDSSPSGTRNTEKWHPRPRAEDILCKWLLVHRKVDKYCHKHGRGWEPAN